MYDRLEVRSAPAIKEIVARLRRAKVVGMDETGWRQDGVPGWRWIARTDKLSLYRVELSRGRWVAESILGAKYAGTLVSDFYSVYVGQGTWRNASAGRTSFATRRRSPSSSRWQRPRSSATE